MPKETDFGLQVDGFLGGDYSPDRDGTVCTCSDEGFGVDEERGGDLALMYVFEKTKELRRFSLTLPHPRCGSSPFWIQWNRIERCRLRTPIPRICQRLGRY